MADSNKLLVYLLDPTWYGASFAVRYCLISCLLAMFGETILRSEQTENMLCVLVCEGSKGEVCH